jgi:2,4-dienoyl-CoA reductase-like NADH-dependent reductase (Old Yellow Enzyme family)/thioredoxin reductase
MERAKGGAGLIIAEPTAVDTETGKALFSCPNLDEDKYIPGFGELAEAVHAYGAKIATQLWHMGRQVWKTGPLKGRQPVSASDTYFEASFPPGAVHARALTIKEIETLIEKFAVAAWRAKVAGLDAIEFHGTNGYLIAQFFSPYTNKRTDRYGGDINGRARFGVEIVERTRELVGPGFPIIFRISADEFIEGGLKQEEARIIAKKLESAGVDAISLSVGLAETYHWVMPPMAVSRGCFVHLSERMKKAVNVPVICAGRINDPVLAERILQEGKADLIAMGRALIADPELPNKAAEGRLDDIRVCIADNECVKRTRLDFPLRCTLNPAVGKEREFKITPAEKPKHVLVVGGGPAGMEAARVAAMRGHKVTLYEKEDRLGGQLLLAALPPHKEEIKNVFEYLIRQIEKLGVKIELGKEVTPELVEKLKPDVVILATGAKPLIPNIPGVKRKNVYTSWEVLKGEVEVGDKVVIIGGGQVGCETADFLSDKRCDVIIVEMQTEIAADMDPWGRVFLLERLKEKKVNVMTNTKVFEITHDGVDTIDKNLNRCVLKADTIILAVGSMPNVELSKTLKGKVPQLYSIGDCVEPRKCFEAIHDASRVAHEI